MTTHQTSEAGEFSKADIDRVANALWDTLCPGIRETEEDVDYYRELARRAIDMVRSPGDPQEIAHLRAQLAEAEREKEDLAQRLKMAEAAPDLNGACISLCRENLRSAGVPEAAFFDDFVCNAVVLWKRAQAERDAAQAWAGEMEGVLRECLPWLKFKKDLAKRIDAALAGWETK